MAERNEHHKDREARSNAEQYRDDVFGSDIPAVTQAH